MTEQSERLTPTKFYLLSAMGFCIIPPSFFALLHFIDGSRPLITEFEAGAIFGVVLIRLMEAFRAALKSSGGE